jgi:hypothetical protein
LLARKRTKFSSVRQALEFIATTRSASVPSFRFIGTSAPFGRKSVCVSQSISAIYYFSTHIGDEMKNSITLFAMLLLLAASASAEIKSVDIKIFGMD